MPDKTVPALLMERWGGWVMDCVALLDGDTTFRHWKYDGAYADQPWFDLQVYSVIRQRLIELRNAEMDRRFNHMSAGHNKKRGIGAGRARRPRAGKRR